MKRIWLWVLILMNTSFTAAAESKVAEIKTGNFSAGVSSAVITPVAHNDVVETLASGSKTVGDISDPLYAKSLILSDDNSRIALIALDLGYIHPTAYAELLAALRSQFSFDQVFLSITHTHSGYVGNYDYKALKEKIVSATEAALTTMEPVKIGASEGQLDEAYNRIIRKPGGSAEMLWTNPQRVSNRRVDQSVGVINIKKQNGDTLANIVNYSAHPVVTMDLNNVVISADYPGQLASSLKRRGEGETLFLLGAAGDVNPYEADTKPTAVALKKSNELGEKLADEVMKTLADITQYQARGRFSFSNQGYSLPVVKASDLDVAPAEVNTLILTDTIALASFSGEFFNQFGVRLKQKSPVKHTFFVGYTNGSLGYVPTREAMQYGGYGADLKDLWIDASTGERQLNDAIESLEALYRSRPTAP